jgi:hypothetical protein
VRIVLKNSEGVSYYQFGTYRTDFLVCARCGVYVAAVLRDSPRMYATVNVNTFDIALPQAAEPVDYEGEASDQRVERRRTLWTPATLVENWGTFSERRIR